MPRGLSRVAWSLERSSSGSTVASIAGTSSQIIIWRTRPGSEVALDALVTKGKFELLELRLVDDPGSSSLERLGQPRHLRPLVYICCAGGLWC
jgi:hypothetical protein